MSPLLQYVLDYIEEKNPAHASKLKSRVVKMDAGYFSEADYFFTRYRNFIEGTGRTLDYGIDCYLSLCARMVFERIEFMRTGKYANSSFDEVERSIYLNPEIFEYHMHGLVFAQFLWPDQYTRFKFFSSNIANYLSGPGNYLEIGGGHALYVLEAVNRGSGNFTYHLVDISPSSMELAKGISAGLDISYQLKNIFEFSPDEKFDFITMGEVIEHVENPLPLLVKVRELLGEGGVAYITAPANAPTLDHIYLFNNADEIRAMLDAAGFEIVAEKSQYAEEVSEARARKSKVSLMYAAFVKSKSD